MRKIKYMSVKTGRIAVMVAVLFGFASGAYAQQHPERRMIRSGNKNFDKGNYEDAELDYLKARHANPGSYEAVFNLFDNYYKQERYEDAEKGFESLTESVIFFDEKELSEVYFNKGNALFRQEKYEEALDAFRNAMRFNPDDDEAKFNYAYTKKLLEDDNQDEDGDNNEDSDSDGEGDDQQDDSDGNGDNDNGGQDDSDGDNDQEQNDKEEDRQGGISPEEAERMLDAIQNSEDNTRERIDAEQQPAAAASGKNW
ncbi:MAG: tetratricopeptide repeat protein [Rikenellaceae bacterium]|nr:tetratricopeptide repeat protein [Rikenellaceae bacterium]